MSRPKSERRRAAGRIISALVGVLGIVAPACSYRAEQRALQNFFDLSRLGDRALGSIATVRFHPTADGVVTIFTIKSVERESPKPLTDDPRTVHITALSLGAQGGSDVAGRQGELLSESVKASAPVALENGQTVQKTITVVLARARLNQGGSPGRWIVTGFTSYAER